jgi:hypothetical protein
MTGLTRLSGLLLALLVVHVADHVARQHRSVPAELSPVGTLGLLAVAIVLGLALRRRREAPLAAAVVGISTALGFLAIHVLPRWGPFSDPYPAVNLDPISWATMLAPMLAALALGVAGLRRVRSTDAAVRA